MPLRSQSQNRCDFGALSSMGIIRDHSPAKIADLKSWLKKLTSLIFLSLLFLAAFLCFFPSFARSSLLLWGKFFKCELQTHPNLHSPVWVGHSRQFAHNCAHLWPFGPVSKRNFRRKMTTIVGNRGQLLKPPFAKPPFRLSQFWGAFFPSFARILGVRLARQSLLFR